MNGINAVVTLCIALEVFGFSSNWNDLDSFTQNTIASNYINDVNEINIEWRFEGHERVYPFKEYERKYVDGVKTKETRYTGENRTTMVYIDDILVVNKTYSLPKEYNPGENPEARRAFNIMQAGAKKEGINIYIISGFRSYKRQEELYNRYVKLYGQNKADTFSARPGYSEHQTGLAFDLNSVENLFANTKESEWIKNNSHEYGFIVRYPKDKISITGYEYEPWHIRYLGIDLATKVFESGLCLEEFLGINSFYDE